MGASKARKAEKPLSKPSQRNRRFNPFPELLTPVMDRKVAKELIEKSSKLSRPCSKVASVCALVLLFCVFFITFEQWLQLNFECHMLPRLMGFSIPAPALAEVLPDRLGVWFEEASVVIDSRGCHRYFQPYIRFGRSLLQFFFFLHWMLLYRIPKESSPMCFLYPLTLLCELGSLDREWSRTRGQYLTKLEERRCKAQNRIVPVERVIQNEALEVLAELNEFGHFIHDSNMQCLQHKLIYERIRNDGIPYCIDFMNDALDKVSQGNPRNNAKKGLQGEEPTPLYVQGSRLDATIAAAQKVLGLKGDDKNYVVSGSKRDLMSINLKQARSQRERLLQIVRATTGSHPSTEEFMRALLEEDRQERRKARRSLAGPPQREDSRKPESTDLLAADAPAERPTDLSLAEHESGALGESVGQVEQRQPDEPETVENFQLVSSPAPSIEVELPKTEPLTSHENGQDLVTEPLTSHENGQDLVSECICCMEHEAVIVFTLCGHLTYCKSCSRKTKQGVYFRSLPRCPFCRQESKTQFLDRYKGTVYGC